MRRIIIIAFALASIATGYLWAGEAENTKAPTVDTANVSLTVYFPSGKKTASGLKIDSRTPYNHRWVAVSRDLIKKYPFGTLIEIHGAGYYSGTYQVQDLTHKKFKNRIDILIGRRQPLASLRGVKVTKSELCAIN